MVFKSILLSFAIISNSMAIIPSILNIPKQGEHARFFLNRYWKWQNQNIFNWNEYLTPLEAKIATQLIQFQSRWISDRDNFEKESLLIGYHYQKRDSMVSYSLSLSVSRSQFIVELARLYKIKEFSAVNFILWRTKDNSLCFGRSEHKNIQRYRCYNRESLLETQSFFERSLPPENKVDILFHDSVIKVREVVFDGRRELFYYLASSQFSLIPEELKKFVVIHGTETRLPFDKIQMGSNGDVSLFYP